MKLSLTRLAQGAEALRLCASARGSVITSGIPWARHGGDGKANQCLLRGSNLEQESDFVSDAEGTTAKKLTQRHDWGYTASNFLISEWINALISQVSGKGTRYESLS